MKKANIGSPLQLAKSLFVSLMLIFIITAAIRAEAPATKTKNNSNSDANSKSLTNRNTAVKSAEAFSPLVQSVPVFIQPLGDFAIEDLPIIIEALEAQYYVKVAVLPAIPLPAENVRTKRGRYRAEALLDFLGAQCPVGSKILGLTNQDIAMAKGAQNDWGVFGLGDYCGAASIISSYRIKTSSANRADLLALIARHELGHNLGLRHCKDNKCLMAAGDDLSNDAATFCSRCATKIARFLKPNP